MAMSGLRELSTIQTPPVDRLAVRTYVMEWDEMVVREALLREHHRGGQSFIVVPRIADMAELGQPTGDLSGSAAGEEPRASIWPHVEERIVDLVADHRSTLVFANSRRLAERLTTRLNEIWSERLERAALESEEAEDSA